MSTGYNKKGLSIPVGLLLVFSIGLMFLVIFQVVTQSGNNLENLAISDRLDKVYLEEIKQVSEVRFCLDECLERVGVNRDEFEEELRRCMNNYDDIFYLIAQVNSDNLNFGSDFVEFSFELDIEMREDNVFVKYTPEKILKRFLKD